MNPKIWTPRYVKNRINLCFYELFNKDKPWIVPKAAKWLDENLNTNMSGVEFGSGRSTIWYAKRLKNLISIEDHQGWYNTVNEDLKSANIKNTIYILRSSEVDGDKDPPYVETINDMDNNSFDFIVVDGKLRNKIALRVIEKLKSGGFLLLDDAERYIPLKTYAPYSYMKEGKSQKGAWKKFSSITKDWKQLHFSSGVTDTVILIKP